MGTLGNSIQTTVVNLLDNVNFQTNITLTEVSRATTNRGGYGGEEISENTINTVGIPANYVKNRSGFEPYGDLKQGESRIIIKGDEDIDDTKKYTITMNGLDFDVIEVKPLLFNDVIVAYALRMSRRQ